MPNYKNQKLCPGHNACAGCGELAAVQAALRGLPNEVIIASATGCIEVTTTSFPESSWGIPWIHSLFENAAAAASGVLAALKAKGDNKTRVVAIGGDGATYDIGLGLISGMWERGERILYICFDTEAYSNTGIQASGATPYGASTTTTPSGQGVSGATTHKKDLLGIALAHGLKYVAQSTAGFPDDITNKIKKALTVDGPSYVQILAPCIPGWRIKNDAAGQMGKLAVKTGLYPLLEYTNGQLTASSITTKFTPAPLADYLGRQGRFKNLNASDLKIIDKIVKQNISKYRL